MSALNFITLLLLGLGLSFDSFAVSVSCGLMRRQIQFNQAVPIAITFALIQGLFPLAGWLIGDVIKHLISSIDHWIALILLSFIGGKMIFEGMKPHEEAQKFNPFNPLVILSLSIATSIDALAVGLSFGVLEMTILLPALIIGSVTFLASMLGMLFGKNISPRRSHQPLILGGIILIGLGLKIMVEHVFI